MRVSKWLLGVEFVVVAVVPGLAGAQGETGNVCVRDYRGGAICTANDVRIEALTVVSVVEDCVSGVPGETEVVFEALVSSAGSPDRYDIGLYLALDGGSARDGDSCYHDFLSGPLTATPTYGDQNSDTIPDLSDGPWWDGAGDADLCGDIETNTQLFKTLPALRFACIDNNGDGSADVSVCTSWDNNTGSTCSSVVDAFPGTNSKCSCTGVELGIAPEPAITIVKSPALQAVPAGGTADFSFSVTSRTTISNVVVSDPDCDAAPAFTGGDSDMNSQLTPDETWTYTCSKSNVMAEFTNTATVIGDGPLGAVQDVDSADVTVSAAAMDLTKTGVLNDGGDGVADAGDTVGYTFELTNTGSVVLTNIAVIDPLPGLSAIACPGGNPIPSLAVAASVQCTATLVLSQAMIDGGQVDNTASSTSDQVGPVTDSTSVPLTAAAAMSLVKDGVLDLGGDGVADPGDLINYTFSVTNTGNLTLSNTEVTDPLIASITCPGGNPIPSIPPGGSVQCTGSYTLVLADINNGHVVNTATADSDNTVPITDEETTPLPGATAAIGVAKRVTAVADAGGGQFDVSLELTVENLGTADLANVQVVDDLSASFPAPVTFSIAAGPTAGGSLTANAGFNGAGDQNLLVAGASTLAVGVAGTVSVTVRVAPNGAQGPFFNTAVATADSQAGPVVDTSDDGSDPDPDGDGDADEPGENDPTPITIATSPFLDASKSSSFNPATQDHDGSGDLTPGDGLSYTVVLTNSGSGDALNVVFNDTPDANTTLVVGSVTASHGVVVSGNTAGDAHVTVDVGGLAAGGGSATFSFDVVVVNPLPVGVSTVVNQGVATGSNFPDAVTDDPDVPGDSDPTTDTIGRLAGEAIPTLSELGVLVFIVLLAAAACVVLRR